MTNGGLGVAFFASFHNGRYFLPVRPIEVSPVGLRAFWTRRGLRGLISEFLWIWLPMAAVPTTTFAASLAGRIVLPVSAAFE